MSKLNGIVTCATAQGLRPSQEDYYVHLPFTLGDDSRGHLLAVMDGHGGKAAAETCAKLIPELFTLSSATRAAKALRDLVAALHERTKHFHEGTTISLACICERKRTATVAVLGDSPVWVLAEASTFSQSVEHNVHTHAKERAAVTARGAFCDAHYFYDPDTDKGLQVTRALGDAELDAYLNRTPEIKTYKLDAESIVIVASDGMSRPRHADREIYSFCILRQADEKGSASKVLKWRDEIEMIHDNATVLLWVSE